MPPFSFATPLPASAMLAGLESNVLIIFIRLYYSSTWVIWCLVSPNWGFLSRWTCLLKGSMMPFCSTSWLCTKCSELVIARRMEGKLSSRLGTGPLKVRIQFLLDGTLQLLELLLCWFYFALTTVDLAFLSCAVRILSQNQAGPQACCENSKR